MILILTNIVGALSGNIKNVLQDVNKVISKQPGKEPIITRTLLGMQKYIFVGQ